MIRRIFLPPRIGSKRLYAQKILGLTIQEDVVSCAKIYAKRSKNIIEELIDQTIEDGPIQTYSERATQAIKEVVARMEKYDQLRIALSASLVVFKELKVPFLDEDKIRMILEYEIEPMLPFSVDEAIIDFIISKQSKEDKTSQILVAAVRKEDIQRTLDMYLQAGVDPACLTVDLFAIYSLYKQIPEYKSIEKSSVIIDLGAHSTQIAFLDEGCLRLTRIIPRGILTVLKTVSNEIEISLQQAQEKLKKYGLDPTGDSNYEKSLQKHIINFFNDIQFTLNSFSLKIVDYQKISKMFFTGKYSELKGLSRFSQNLLQIPCEVFSFEKIFVDTKFKNKIKEYISSWNKYLVALGTALPSEQQANFDLRRKEFSLPQKKLVKSQLVTASLLLFLIFTVLIIRGYFQINKLSSFIQRIEDREKSKLRRMIPKEISLPRQVNLQKLSQKAENVLEDKKEIWMLFEKTGIRPLVILQELTNIIDKRKFDVTIETIAISEQDSDTKIEIEGFFRSKTGSDHFRYFAELQKRFSESKILKLWDEKEEIDSRLVEDKGIKFFVKLRLKEL
ncbi:hypothetical protein GF322_03490 [Candidatus Dependentiae bacterium]|nr:hypothetical protein [Candidatus Dependentiae bacterium]